MAKKGLTDYEGRNEIERLKKSPYVKLAKKEESIRCRERQYLYTLRGYEKKGKALSEAGITMEILEGMSTDDDFAFCAED